MKIDYRETTTDLLKRIDIHNQYGGKNIDEWMLGILQIKPGIKILDVACGAGKQCFSYHDTLNGKADITGVDVSDELLSQARAEAQKRHAAVNFLNMNFDQPLKFETNTFDLLSCCFAIYYSENIPFTIREMHRVLKNGGRLFTSGPMPANKKTFYDIIKEATGKPIPRMPGSSRYDSEILGEIKAVFSKVDVEIFENPLTFNKAEPFIEYTRASLSEDRKLWSSLFTEKDSFVKVMEQISATAHKWVDRDGKIVMTKVVGGIIATK